MRRLPAVVLLVLAGCSLAAAASAGSSASGVRAAAMPACFGAAARDPLEPCVNPDLTRSAIPSPYDAALEPSEPCERIEQAQPPACAFGVRREQAATSVALLGDSHSTHWRAALAYLARKRRWHGVSINRNLCPFTLATTMNPERCRGWTHGVLRWLRNHREVTAVFVSANAGSGVRALPGRSRGETKLDGYLRAWNAIPRSVREIFVLRDVPRSRGDTADCVTSALRHDRNPATVCAQPRDTALPRDLEAITADLDPADRARTVDLSSYMCDDEQCMPVIGGALVIKDIGHMTRTFSRTLGPYLGREVDRLRRARRG